MPAQRICCVSRGSQALVEIARLNLIQDHEEGKDENHVASWQETLIKVHEGAALTTATSFRLLTTLCKPSWAWAPTWGVRARNFTRRAQTIQGPRL